MSTVILTNWTVYYASDAGAGGYKQITWTGAGAPETNTNTVNELYSALADLFSISTQNVAATTIPIRAVTPTLYEIGGFDTGDLEPWFIDPIGIQHLAGGGLNTNNWTRVEHASDPNQGNSGVIKMTYTAGGTAPSSADVGETITMTTDTDSGTVLYVDATNLELWIRPTSSITANNFDNTPTPGGAFTIAGGSGASGTQTAAATTGEKVWANIYSIGSIVDETQIYVVQNFTKFTSFWASGHIDRLFLTSDGFDTGLIDSGFLTVYARQYTNLYDHFQVDASSGGRNPVPLAASNDINNNTGYRTMTVAGSSGTWDVDNYIYRSTGGLTWSTTDTKGVITAVSGSDITYYIIGDLTDFVVSADDVQEYTGTTDGDASATSISTIVDAGPAALSVDPTFVFGAGTDEDLNNGNGAQPYDVHIDVQGNTLADFYEFTKYVTRRGSTTPLSTDHLHNGEQYDTTGITRIDYDGQTVNFLEGAVLTGQVSGATATIVADHDAGGTGTLIVADTRGTFQDDENILDDQGTPGDANIILTGGITTTLVSKVAPFGTFAGGTFFGARGVWISNMAGADANNYSLVDSNDVVQDPPASIPITVSSVVSGDRVSVFRTTGNNSIVDKAMYTSPASGNNITDPDYVIVETPDTDTPTSGSIRIVATSGLEERYTYSSFTASTFTLNITDHPSGLSQTYDNTYTVYIPYLDQQATGTSVSTSVTYNIDTFVVTRVRNKGILPFSIQGQIISTGLAVSAIRATDSIVNLP